MMNLTRNWLQKITPSPPPTQTVVVIPPTPAENLARAILQVMEVVQEQCLSLLPATNNPLHETILLVLTEPK